MPGAYTITISATDLASGVFDAANKRVEALNKRVAAATAPFRRFGESLEKFSKVTGLSEIATGFGNVARTGTEAFRSLARIVEPLAAIIGVASIAGIYKLTTAWGEFASALGNQAQRAGASASQLYVLQNAARLAGVDAETLTGGITTLNDNLRNAAFGGAPAFLNVLANLHLSFEDLQRMNPEQRLKALADALASVKSPTDRALYTKEIFGGEGMIPFLNAGAAGVTAWEEAARRLAGTMTPDDIARAQAFRQAQVGLAESIIGVGNALSTVLAPTLTPLVADVTDMAVHMREWLDVNKEWLRNTISEEVGKFVSWLKAVDWRAIWTDIEEIATKADSVAHALGGWITVGEDVAKFMIGSWLARMLLPFVTLGSAVAGLTFSIGKTLVGAFVLAGDAATLFNNRAMALPVFKALAIAAGVFEMAKGGTLVSDLPAGSPLLAVDAESRQRDGGGVLGTIKNWLGIGQSHISLGQQSEYAKTLASAFMGMGYTREGAAAMIGSGLQESSLNPQAGAGTAHQGTFQWNAARQAAIEQHFGKQLMNMTPTEQAAAAGWEIDTKPEFAGLSHDLRSSHDLEGLNNSVTRRFEAPGNYDKEVPLRLGLSQGALSAIGPAGALPSASGAGLAGAPGANGRVDLNVKVQGDTPTVVTGKSTGGVDLYVAQPGMLFAQ